MRKDKARAYGLRRQSKSYSEISRVLGIPKSTLAAWFKNEEWSQKIRDVLGAQESLSFPKKLVAIQKANKKRWAKIHQSYRDEGEKEFMRLKNNPLFLAGVMLYWGEGEKGSGSRVKLANTDPVMIKIFYIFLKNVIGVPQSKICVWLLLYPDLKDAMQKNFWSRATGIPLSQFKKSIYIKGKHPTRRLSYGACSIYVNSRSLKERIIKWLELYQDFLRSPDLTLEK